MCLKTILQLLIAATPLLFAIVAGFFFNGFGKLLKKKGGITSPFYIYICIYMGLVLYITVVALVN